MVFACAVCAVCAGYYSLSLDRQRSQRIERNTSLGFELASDISDHFAKGDLKTVMGKLGSFKGRSIICAAVHGKNY